MTRIIVTLFCLGMLLTLDACSGGHEPLKAPCPFMLGFENPCEVTPLNQMDL